MRSGSKDFSLIEANVMFTLERVLNNCRFVNSIVVGIRDVFFETGLNGSTFFSNVGFPTQIRNLVDALG